MKKEEFDFTEIIANIPKAKAARERVIREAEEERLEIIRKRKERRNAKKRKMRKDDDNV